MPCFKPLKGYRSREVNPSGKRSWVRDAAQGYKDMPLTLSCSQCIGCRLERSRQWAARCMHEASLHDDNCFVTLTYDPEFVPSDGSLKLDHFQKFMKRLRFKFQDVRIRFFHCGEYGELYGRPHYHVLLFGFDFSDKVYWKSVNDQKYFVSSVLGTYIDGKGVIKSTEEGLWPYGISTIGAVTFESAAYVARYITKKITGAHAQEFYYEGRKPEYVTMSRKPGIGKKWFEKYKDDVFPDDFILVRGKKSRVPKFYSAQYELSDPLEYGKVVARRQIKGEDHEINNTPDRLEIRQFIQYDRISKLRRGFESGD